MKASALALGAVASSLALGCATIKTDTTTASKLVRQENKRVATGQFAKTITTNTAGDRLIVRVQKAPTCQTVRVEEHQDERAITRTEEGNTVLMNAIIGAAATVAGGYFLATSSSRPDMDNRYSRDQLSKQGALGIGGAALAVGVGFGAVALIDGMKLRDTFERLPPRRSEVPQGGSEVCGEQQPAADEEVTIFVATAFSTTATTNAKGVATFEIAKEVMARVAEGDATGTVVVWGAQATWSIAGLASYAEARSAQAHRDRQDAALRQAQEKQDEERRQEEQRRTEALRREEEKHAAREREAARKTWPTRFALLMAPYAQRVSWRMANYDSLPNDGGQFLLVAIMGPNQSIYAFNRYEAIKRLDRGATVPNMINLALYAKRVDSHLGPEILRNTLGMPLHVVEALIRLAEEAEKIGMP